tara:strand:- start:1234 stop:1383 length:150 start_codon:yes stop_codon:yes gene_type:complete
MLLATIAVGLIFPSELMWIALPTIWVVTLRFIRFREVPNTSEQLYDNYR